MPATTRLGRSLSLVLLTLAGCGWSGTPTVAATDVDTTAPLAADGRHLFFAQWSDAYSVHRIVRVPLEGGAVETVAEESSLGGLGGLVVAGDAVWWLAQRGDDYALRRAPKSGGPAEDAWLLKWTPWLQADATSLYAMQPFERTFGGGNVERGVGIFRFTPGREPEGPLPSIEQPVVAPDGTIYGAGYEHISVLPPGQTFVEEGPATPGVSTRRIAVGPRELFYVSVFEDGAGLGHVPLEGGYGRAIVITGDLPIDAPNPVWTTDARTVAWFALPGDAQLPTELLRVDLVTEAQSRLTIPEIGGVQQLLVAGDSLWFVTGTAELMRVPR